VDDLQEKLKESRENYAAITLRFCLTAGSVTYWFEHRFVASALAAQCFLVSNRINLSDFQLDVVDRMACHSPKYPDMQPSIIISTKVVDQAHLWTFAEGADLSTKVASMIKFLANQSIICVENDADWPNGR
jgi:hypothetical protein